MRPVVQADQTGCGVAAVAAIAGVSSAHAIEYACARGVWPHEAKVVSPGHASVTQRDSPPAHAPCRMSALPPPSMVRQQRNFDEVSGAHGVNR